MADPVKSTLFTDAGISKKGDACIVLVKTAWNAAIVNELEKGCLETLQQYGVAKIRQLEVPGAVEIPFAIKQHWERTSKKKRPDAYIALGTVIRGGTPHFEYVCQSVTHGILQLNLQLPAPTIFGVLTVDNEAQAMERIGGAHGHKGIEAALTALKMIELVRRF